MHSCTSGPSLHIYLLLLFEISATLTLDSESAFLAKATFCSVLAYGFKVETGYMQEQNARFSKGLTLNLNELGLAMRCCPQHHIYLLS